MKKKIKIMLCLSGGIDSTCSLVILKRLGFNINTVFIKNTLSEISKLCNNNHKELSLINLVSKIFLVACCTINISNIYWDFVLRKLIKSIKNNLTMNPDIECNKKIKFNTLILKLCYEMNYNLVSTGHYLIVEKDMNWTNLIRNNDKFKDQTFFMSQVKKKNLTKSLFPLGNYLKSNVKYIIKNINLINYNKKESMGICFIENNNFIRFISKYIKKHTGKILFENKVIGHHDGTYFYSIGQRKYLNTYTSNLKMYVKEKDSKNNLIYMSNKNNLIKKRKFIIRKIAIESKVDIIFICDSKCGQQSNFSKCLVDTKNKIVIFKILKDNINPGQYLSLYINNKCIGGIILK